MTHQPHSDWSPAWQLPYVELILAFTVVAYVLESYVDWRQHRLFSVSSRPRELEAIMDEETFAKSQRYNRDKSAFGFVRGAAELVQGVVVLWCFVLLGAWRLAGRLMVAVLGSSYAATQG
eukprot:TRINITY_DN30380_c0_g1_i2.p1 TRINITY_DN30380_c0_g1~~TRINITY_DN30380_c0_g1_i2.p1  ORF type:complete len:120 (-),score=40.65 TRINITY_DN30380_c0_g1_i2:38-397(-)